MNKYLLTLLSFSFLVPVQATDIKFSGKLKKFLKAYITHAEPHDFDTFKLSNRYNKEFILVCAGNPFHNNKNSYIEYQNYFGVHATDFNFDNNHNCHTLKEYLYGVFPGVSKSNPIEISFNRDTKQIESIQLPNLDALEDGEEAEDILRLSTL